MNKNIENPFKILLRFLSGKPGSLRFRTVSIGNIAESLRYETIADGKRNMRDDLRNLGGDLKENINKIYKNGSQDRTE